MNFYLDSSEWKWLYKNAIDWDKIIPLYHPQFPTEDGFNSADELIDYFEDVLAATGKWGAEAIAPRAKVLDAQGGGVVVDGETKFNAPLNELYREAKELKFHSLSVEQEYGGMGLPSVIGFMAFGHVCRGCQASAAQITFFGTIADMIARFASEEWKEKLIPRIASGEISGSMCLTEPDCGSDLGAIKTTATTQDDGSYLLNGVKIFITNGGADIGLVLGRIKGAADGLSGLSLFLVERIITKDGEKVKNFMVAKTEEKMGQHGSLTCEVIYENTVAHLIGEESHGFQYMLFLMNEARTGVGMQSIGGMEAAISMVKKYGGERTQFGKRLLDLPLYKRNIMDMETELDGFRALCMDSISHYDIYQKLDMKIRKTGDLNKHERAIFNEAKKWVRRRTPLLKYYGTETFSSMAIKCLQGFGGCGYMREFEIERIVRDSCGALLYEGTSQIQSLMALKDLMKYILKNPAKYFQTILFSHPIGNFASNKGQSTRTFYKSQYEFRKNIASLLLKIFKPDFDISSGDAMKIFSVNTWFKEEKFDLLLVHSEKICQALSYLETLRVLAKHTEIDESRVDLFSRYQRLINPRLVAIYEGWRTYENE
ncbi:MAG: hypothetical protein HOE90_02725 [Bacteriovoracaceae bacterium]|mgnify:CR=1 FL=1|jgi:3-(methylthio)propanoyl-CoA dehydrogenase|nr:hypothetical protein [Bacteriovoracaceae bacterium]